jgi:hypothetical protein
VDVAADPNLCRETRRRLTLLATAFVARGMEPDSAYAKARYYIDGPGRRLNWISALAQQEPVDAVPVEASASSPAEPELGHLLKDLRQAADAIQGRRRLQLLIAYGRGSES